MWYLPSPIKKIIDDESEKNEKLLFIESILVLNF